MQKGDTFKNKNLPITLKLFYVASFVLLTTANSILASQTSTREIIFFDLPRQALSQAIIEFASQANITIIVQNDLVKNLTSNTVRGPMPVKSALNRLLSKTQLSFIYSTNYNTFTIVTKAKEPQLLTVRTVSSDIEEVIITGTQYPFRYQTILSSSIKNSLPLFDSSRFHTLIPRELIEDLSPDDIVDALKYVSGAARGDGRQNSNDDFYLRGFQRNSIYLDGYRVSDETAAKFDTRNVDHAEILKGPSTILFGQTGAGGIVNIQRKKPKRNSSFFLELKSGANNLKKQIVDTNIAGKIDDTIDVRLVYIHDEKMPSTNISSVKRQTIATNVRIRGKQNSILDIGYEKQLLTQKTNIDLPIYNSNGEELNSNLSDIYKTYSPKFTADIDLLSISSTFSTKSGWQIRNSGLLQIEHRYGLRPDRNTIENTDLFARENINDQLADLKQFSGQIAVPILQQERTDGIYLSYGSVTSIYDQEEHETNLSLNFFLNGEFTAADTLHNLSCGLELYHQDRYQLFALSSDNRLPTDWKPEIEFYSFSNNLTNLMASTYDSPSIIHLKEIRTLRDDIGVFAQLNSEWNQKISSTLGLRYSFFTGQQKYITRESLGLVSDIEDISLQFAGTYHFKDDALLFFNHTESTAIKYIIDDFHYYSDRPEKARQIELGIKNISWDGRLIITLAAFNIRQKNNYDIYFEQGYRKLFGPSMRIVHGLETDISLQTSSSTQVLISGSLLTQRYPSLGDYQKLVQNDDSTFSFFARQEVNTQWSATTGLYRVSDKSINNGGGIRIPHYTTLDFGIHFVDKSSYSTLRIDFLIKNLTDTNYFASTLDDVRVTRGPGRSIQVQSSIQY